MGIIGPNGAGKTTLLKILSEITEPTEGEAIINGRIASLLEVGTGFHPELTGKENIFMNGAILGMTRAEIKSKFDEIVAFSEVEKFLDTPVKRYSSGMQVRLAFAVAAHLEPEILLVDEVLAVGDLAFQKKCLGKMGEVAGGGRTILFVSHNMGVLRSLCESAIWLDHGLIIQKGTADEVVSAYLKQQTRVFDESACVVKRNPEETRHKSLYFESVEMFNVKGEHTNVLNYNDELALIVSMGGQPKERFSVEFFIRSELGQVVSAGASGAYHGVYFGPNVKKIKINIGPITLTSGKYVIAFSIIQGVDGSWGVSRADTWENACAFTIAECKPFRTNWEIPSFREGLCVLQQSFTEAELQPQSKLEGPKRPGAL